MVEPLPDIKSLAKKGQFSDREDTVREQEPQFDDDDDVIGQDDELLRGDLEEEEEDPEEDGHETYFDFGHPTPAGLSVHNPMMQSYCSFDAMK